jgi:hypothetical protein
LTTGMEKLIKQIIAEEFWPEPAVRAARRLKDVGATEADVLRLDIRHDVRVKVANALRDLESERGGNLPPTPVAGQ